MKLSPKLFKNKNVMLPIKYPNTNPVPPQEDKHEEIIRPLQREFENHNLSCNKIYVRLIKYRNMPIYPSLVNFAKLLVNYRMFNVYTRLEKSIGNISFLHDIRFSFLYLFIGLVPIIDNKTLYFSFYLNYEDEDMSKIYIYCRLMSGTKVKKDYPFYSFDALKNFISAYIINFYSKK